MAAPQGFWERHTSTIDWCEENYVVTSYIAEFWNTLSNAVLIVGPLIMLAEGISNKMERHFLISFALISVVGIGSLLFHMTLRYSMQLMDEVPMLWASTTFIYAGLTVKTDVGEDNSLVQTLLYILCSSISLIYILYPLPRILQGSYAILNAAVILLSVRIMLTMRTVRRLFLTGLVSYILGFTLWSIDYTYCSHLRSIRELHIASYSGMVLQLHAWWHVFSGVGAYLGLLFTVHARYSYLQRNPQIRFFCSVWPYIHLPEKPEKLP